MRRKNDFYPTESKLTKEMLKIVGQFISGLIYEPCAGKNHIVNELLLRYDFNNIASGDITLGRDACNLKQWPDNIRWTITNPPFKHALKILQNALLKSEKGVIFLTRITFLEPTYDRQDFWTLNPPDLLIINPRTSFTGDGKSDSTTTCWICYGDFGNTQPINFIRKLE